MWLRYAHARCTRCACKVATFALDSSEAWCLPCCLPPLPLHHTPLHPPPPPPPPPTPISDETITLSWAALVIVALFYLDDFLAKMRPAVKAFVAEEKGTAVFLAPLLAGIAALAFPLYSSRWVCRVHDVVVRTCACACA